MLRNISPWVPLALLGATVLPGATAHAQAGDPAADAAVLFTVDGAPVTVEEFDYIYAKTNGDSADYSRASLTEYLDLYKRFKLKVAKARDMGLDTVPALNQELAGYRKQLTDSYLLDAEVTEPLAKELHTRKTEDVDILHLSVDLPREPGADTAEAFAKISAARERLVAGEEWGAVAAEVSTDPSAARNNGEVGFVTAPFPDGLYLLENAVYGTEPGEISDVVRSDVAYHIVKVRDRREARGEVEAAHIFLRKPEGDDADDAAVKARIDSIHAALEAGADFGELARTLSEDTRSAPRGGYVGKFGINRYERSFEDAAFGLTEDSTYSEPFETRVGWHVLQRLGRSDQGPWEELRPDLMARVKRMPRFAVGQTAMVERLRGEYDFTEEPLVLNNYIASLPDSFLTYKWAPEPGAAGDATLMTFGGDRRVVTLADFAEYLGQNASQRLRLAPNSSVDAVARELYGAFAEEQTMAYAEQRLDEDNPAFYNLMREYREGILLFEATKMNVWDKAGTDTAGLEAFYAANKDDYQWDERVVLDTYTFPSERADEIAKELSKFARKNGPDAVLARFNATDSALVAHAERTVERGRDEGVDAMTWKAGTAAAPVRDEAGATTSVTVVREVLPPGPKALDEARGYVIADYQDELEKRWVEELSSAYPIEVDEASFEALVQ